MEITNYKIMNVDVEIEGKREIEFGKRYGD